MCTIYLVCDKHLGAIWQAQTKSRNFVNCFNTFYDTIYCMHTNINEEVLLQPIKNRNLRLIMKVKQYSFQVLKFNGLIPFTSKCFSLDRVIHLWKISILSLHKKNPHLTSFYNSKSLCDSIVRRLIVVE